MADHPLIVRNLDVSYADRGGRKARTRVVRDVSFEIPRGTVLGLVGESGSGKSTSARAVMGLVARDRGTVDIAGQAVPPDRFPRALRRHVQMVFQDPYSSLDPAWTVGRTIAEPLASLCPEVSTSERTRRVTEALEMVGLDASVAERRPRAFSGGQRQRIAIARAIAIRPDVLVCDEPVSALDVSTQNQILAVLRELRHELGVAMLFISHDLAVVRQISTEVAVMYRGRIVESGPTEVVLHQPRHPYAVLLRDAAPQIGRSRPPEAVTPSLALAGPLDPEGSCVFVERCPRALDACRTTSPVLEPMAHGHGVACLNPTPVDEPSPYRAENQHGAASP